METKRIVITGGTSGLGKALAHTAASEGHSVAVISRHADDLPASLRVLNVIGIKGDVSQKNEITRIAAEVSTRLGHVDVLVNNASALGPTPMPLLADLACEDLEEVLATNVLGPFRLTKALLGSMLVQGSGTVVNISSDAAVSAYPGWGAYGVSKSALDHLTRVWSAELSEHGITFLSVDPGDMDTPMHRAAIPDADFDSLYRPEDVARDLWVFVQNGRDDVRYTASEWRA